MGYIPFANTNIDTYFLTNGMQAALYYLNKALARLEIATVGGIPLKSIADANITHDNQGNIIITVKQIGSLMLRYNETLGIVEQSLDGETWEPFVTQGGVTDHLLLTHIGTNTHEQLDAHLDDAALHQGTTDHLQLTNIGTNTHEQIDTHLADTTQHNRPTVAGTPMLTLSPVNLFDVGDGDYQVLPDVLKSQIRIGNIYMKDGGDTLLLSLDGSTWHAIDDHPAPAVLANPVSIGDSLLHDDGGWLEVSYDNGVSYDGFMTLNEYKRKTVHTSDAQFTIPMDAYDYRLWCHIACTVQMPNYMGQDIYIFDFGGQGITLNAQQFPTEYITPGGPVNVNTISNAGAPAYNDYIHLFGTESNWTILDSRGTWV